MSMYYPNGDRVHCGTVLWVKIDNVWQWARFEVTADKIGYFVYGDGHTITAARIDGIDWTKRTSRIDGREYTTHSYSDAVKGGDK